MLVLPQNYNKTYERQSETAPACLSLKVKMGNLHCYTYYTHFHESSYFSNILSEAKQAKILDIRAEMY